MEALSSCSKRHIVYCTCATSFSFIFDRLYLMTHGLSGDGKGVILLGFDRSFM